MDLSNISDIYIGSGKIGAVYKGSNKLWPQGSGPTYKHWKIEFIDDYFGDVHIGEIAFVTPDDDAISHDRIVKITVKSEYQFGPKEGAFDGIANGALGYWTDTGPSPGDPEWLAVEFDSAVTVGAMNINLYNGTVSPPKNVNLYGSDDGATWNLLGSKEFDNTTSADDDYWYPVPLIVVPGTYAVPPPGYA